ncbi:unnamed protein product [Paramecium sonneborni]|uniref:non-specific serine/threonine protein kinase n=1 Tax=Paramecium sonneborni TaxID=65129 RepID=A0A8S1QSE0_9CILI|nr:unnamed protein product [Paramecium sonneborni]
MNNNKLNLLDVLRKKRQEQQSEQVPRTPPIIKQKSKEEIRKYLVQNPKTNLISLFKKKREDDNTPCTRQKLLKYYDSQGRSSILSPICATNHVPQKSVSDESTNALQITIPKRMSLVSPRLQHLNSQTSILESPNEIESFLVQGSNASKLDLDEHFLRIENVDNPRIMRSQSQCQDEAQQTMIPNTLSVPMGKGPRRLQSFSVGDPFRNVINAAEQRRSVRLMRGLSGIHQPKETQILERSRDEAGRKKMNNFVILHELGRGAFGKVRLIYNEIDQQYYAMKIADKNKLKRKLLTKETSAYSLLEQEVAILKKVDHQNIVRLVEVIDDPEERKLYLIMEYVKKGSINSKQYWKSEGVNIDWDEGEKPPKISCEKIRKYLRHFLLGLDYLHNFARILHRDIKPDNLLIDEFDNLKIADFGVAQMYDSSSADLIQGDVGTKAFLPPEAFKTSQVKGKPADIWATGITFFILTQGQHPFPAKNVQQLKEAVSNHELKFFEGTDPDLADFLTCCLKKDSRQRHTLEQLMDHPFITLNGEEPLIEQEFSDENFFISENEISKALSKVTIRATVRVFAKLRQKLNQSRQRIKKQQ